MGERGREGRSGWSEEGRGSLSARALLTFLNTHFQPRGTVAWYDKANHTIYMSSFNIQEF